MTVDAGFRLIETRDGFSIWLPDDLRSLATYVYLEQEDWFEDEIQFVRRFLKPGMRAVDVGAAYGAYALAMAKAVGPTGRIQAFEPASETAATLKRSAAVNRFDWLEVIQAAAADHVGSAEIRVFDNVEYNTLSTKNERTAGAPRERRRETVSVVTLDHQLADITNQPVDFLKIDAEGLEREVISGAQNLLGGKAVPRPLVMIEIEAGFANSNLFLIDILGEFGFLPFRHLRGPNVLVPYDNTESGNESLNLMFCPDERLEAMAAAGLLVSEPLGVSPAPGRWRSYSESRRCSRMQLDAAPDIASFPGTAEDVDYLDVLDLYAVYADDRTPEMMSVRVASLKEAFARLSALCGRAPSLSRHMTLARIGRAMSEVEQTDRALAGALDRLRDSANPIRFSEPFVLPSERMERSIENGDVSLARSTTETLIELAGCAVIELLEFHRHISSYYGDNPLIDYLRLVQSLPYASAALERRLLLDGRKSIAEIPPSSFFAGTSEPIINRDIWRSAGKQG